MNHSDIKIIEDLSLNAWPSHQMQLYDGWILRFSYFYTHRTNCVEQIGASQIPFEEKVNYCEDVYRRWKTPCIFKITPLTDPALETILMDRGYEVQHRTTVMRCDPAAFAQAAREAEMRRHRSSGAGATDGGQKLLYRIETSSRISDEWIDALFSIKGNATVKHLKVVPSMYAAIPKDVICVAARREDGTIAGTGLGILDRDYLGVYAINVDAACRRQGIARKICETLLIEGRRAGAAKAYLQVVTGNTPAVDLYRSLGFEEEYEDWFRVKEPDGE